jgi:CHASE2 domain-containing sensor protein
MTRSRGWQKLPHATLAMRKKVGAGVLKCRSAFGLLRSKACPDACPGVCAFAIPLLVILTFIVDLFGFGSATRLQSEATIVRLTAPWYPARAQDQVSAILIDPGFLAEDSMGNARPPAWPMPYARYADLIEPLIRMGPKAIFLDITFDRPHAEAGDTPDPLVAAIRLAVANGIDVIIARPVVPTRVTGNIFCDGKDEMGEDVPLAFAPVIGPLAGLADEKPAQVRFAAVTYYGCHDHYPLAVGGNAGLPTPAYLLALAMCSDAPDPKRCALPAGEGVSPLIVRWGAFPSRERVARGTLGRLAPCSEVQSAPRSGRLSAGLADLRAGLSQALNWTTLRGHRLTCHYIDEAFASDVLGDAAAVERIVANRVVLIGTAPSIASDLVNNPVNGSVPGVVFHAAATENLIGLGRHYVREPDDRVVALIEALLVAAVIAIALLVERAQRSPGKRQLAASERRRTWHLSAVTMNMGHWIGTVLCIVLGGMLVADVVRGTPIGVWNFAPLVVIAGWTLFKPAALTVTTACLLLGSIATLVALGLGYGAVNWIAVLLAVFAHTPGKHHEEAQHT